MDMDIRKIVCLLLMICLKASSVHSQRCPLVPCDVRTVNCSYRTYFVDARTRLACRGCNFCLQPDTPVDSEGCPIMDCSGPKPANMCTNPVYYNSWVDVNGKQCPTCWAQLCKILNSD